MNLRIFSCWLLVFALILALAACAPIPTSPTATGTRPPTQASSATSSPVATLLPTTLASPTLPGQPQVVQEIILRSLPGVGHNPEAIAVLDGRVYVANRSTNNVSVIEGDRVTTVIAVGKTPSALAADAKTGLVYVANEADDSLSIISANRVVKTVPAPKSPACLVALDGRLYAGGRGENVLAVLDGTSGKRIASVPLQASIGILALDASPVTHLLYASVYDGVEIVDMQKLGIVGRLERSVYVTLGADPKAERFFVSEYDPTSNSQYLVAYDALGRKELGRVLIGSDPRGMAIDPDSGRIYVTNSWTNDVSVIDGKTLQAIATVRAGLQPTDVAIGKDGQAFIVNSNSDNVALLDGPSHRLSGVIPLSMRPQGMVVHPGTGHVYVACASTNSVFILENGRVVAEIPVGLHPTEVALSLDGNTLFVLNYVDGNLMLISTQDKHVLKTTEIGQLPRGLAVAPQNGQVYVSDAVLDQQSQRLIRHTELVTIYRSKVRPISIQIDSKARRAYMVASNGVPGSNGGFIVYVLDLESGGRIEGQVGGLSMTGLALDVEGQRIFSTAGRFGHFQLIVNDASNLKQISALDLPKYPAALAYNPETHHIFIGLTLASNPAAQPGLELWVLDSRGLGTVTTISLPGEPSLYEPDPYELSVDAQRGYLYLADVQRGTVHIVRDMVLPAPPSPTPTDTPTPWPTLTPQPQPSPTIAILEEPTCTQIPGPRFQSYWVADKELRLALRCPTQEMNSGFMAEQAFERGYMLWREADRAIFVFYNDGQWRSFVDRWQESMAEYGCEASPPAGLSQPKRGFGLLWCVEESVKKGLGWALGDERGYTKEWQVFEQGQMIASGLRPIIYILFLDGSFVEYAAR